MRRLLFVDHVDRILGGGEVNLLELLAALQPARRWDLACACPPRSRLGEAVARRGVRVLDHGFPADLNQYRVVGRRFSPWRAWKGWRALCRARRRLGQMIQEERPAVVVTCTNKDALCLGPAARTRGVPAVWWVNDLLTADFFPAPARRAFFWQARRDAARLVAVSDAVAGALRAGGVPADRVVTVHNGIPLERYRRSQRGAWRRQAGLPADATLIGLVGRLTPWKGPELVLRVAAARRGRAPGEHYVLIGQAFNEDQEFAAGLRRFTVEQGLQDRVHFLPFQEAMAEVLTDLDIVLHASTRPEPFGRVIIEAMAVGVPVLAARAGGVPEIITDGEDGLLARPGVVEDYVAGLGRLLAEPGLRARLAAAARRTVEERFSLEKVLQRWQALLEAIA